LSNGKTRAEIPFFDIEAVCERLDALLQVDDVCLQRLELLAFCERLLRFLDLEDVALEFLRGQLLEPVAVL